MNQILWWEVADLSNLEIFIKNHPKNAPKSAKYVSEINRMKISPEEELRGGKLSLVSGL